MEIFSAKAVGDPVLFYTEAINSCFTGTGVNDNMLIRTVVPRSEVSVCLSVRMCR